MHERLRYNVEIVIMVCIVFPLLIFQKNIVYFKCEGKAKKQHNKGK